ncbi:MAG: protein kinase [Planctomycetaceae bacterium]|nr:protein kinase [Planctomycetaceae bacterium]
MSDKSSAPQEGSATRTPQQRSASPPAAAKTVVPDKPEKSEKSNILGDFRLEKKLGQGGMGVVYLAHQISLDRKCALKVLSKELGSKPNFVERFKREARAGAKIDHPHVVRCFAVGEARGLHYVAMELIDGQSMQNWLNDLGKISIPDALHVTLLCAEALKHAHELNMIHRDIKPDNILITKKGVVKVSDLGLAKALDDDMSMTQSGTGLGTPHYMPPEQARNAKHVDHRSDIYALGGTLYHFVTGQTPFKGETIVDLITSKEKGSFTHAKKLNSEVPERMDLMIDKMMARDPQHRYQSMDELIRDLDSLKLSGESLSFIDAPDREVIRRSHSGPASLAPTRPAFTAPTAARTPVLPPSSSEDAERRASAGLDMSERWYVRHTDAHGKPTVSRWTTAQVLQAMKSDRLDASARVTRDNKEPFLPFAQYPEFAAESHKLATRTKTKNKEQSLAGQYAKLEKQYRRQKWWRMLGKLRDGTMGIVGLILYLAIVAVIVIGAIWGGIWVYQNKLAPMLQNRQAAAPAAADTPSDSDSLPDQTGGPQ